jgi:large subunit ribosomal protein L21
MYAVVDDRNQQFRAEPGLRVQIPLNEALEPGASVTFDKVCLVTGGGDGRVGAPYLDGVSVSGTVVGMVKGPKLVVQKFRKRKNSHRRTGFRARFTEIKIDSIDGV